MFISLWAGNNYLVTTSPLRQMLFHAAPVAVSNIDLILQYGIRFQIPTAKISYKGLGIHDLRVKLKTVPCSTWALIYRSLCIVRQQAMLVINPVVAY